VECKNWRAPVGKENIQKFNDTLKDLSLKNGIFASYAGFTEDAETLAEYYGIDLWDPDYLKEEYWMISVGRAEEATLEKPIKLENALPLKLGFLQVAETNLKNKDKIIPKGTLSYRPYFVVAYLYQAKFKDPTRKIHTFKDSGKVFIDGLDGRVLNPSTIKDVKSIAQRLKTIITKKGREESKRTKKLIEELNEGALANYEVKAGEDYEVRKFEPSISKRSIAKSALDYIIQKNTCEIEYAPKGREEEFLLGTKTITYIPKIKDINIRGVTLVYVPKWQINYEFFNRVYTKEVLAFSGAVLEDTLHCCPKHIGFLKKETVAICEVCGQALFNEHVFQCPICGKWLCEEDGVSCESCRRVYCKEHTLLKCEICNRPLCNECKLICPICGKRYSQKHTRICDNCGKTVCTNCVTATGFIRKKVLCSTCQ